MALFIARIGVNAVAGHQIVANFSGVLYMLPLSLASATSTLVAQSIGGRRLEIAEKYRLQASGCLPYLPLSSPVPSGWEKTGSSAFTHQTKPLPPMRLLFFCSCAACFFFDAIQVTASYVLRAYKVVLAPTLLYVMTLWCIGLGCGYMFAFNFFPDYIPPRITGSSGFWFSNCVSLVILSVGMIIIMRKTEKKAEVQFQASLQKQDTAVK